MLHLVLQAGDQAPVFVLDFADEQVLLRHRYHLRQNLLWSSDVVVFPPPLDDHPEQPQVNLEADYDEGEPRLKVTVLSIADGEEAESSDIGGANFVKLATPSDPLLLRLMATGRGKGNERFVRFEDSIILEPNVAMRTRRSYAVYRPLLATDEFTALRAEARARLRGKPPRDYEEADFLDAAYAGNRYLLRLASDPATPPELLDLLVQTGWLPVLRRIARNPQTSLETLKWVGGNGLFSACVARNPALELHLLEEPSLAQHVEASLAFALISNEDDDRNFDEEEGEE